ncbi:CotH kinase family protein [candidate division KSB1 bacterium]|nr:CotH kinase family protein [candidate division KSB1 bacterium]
MPKPLSPLIFLFFCIPFLLQAQDVFINEVMSSNTDFLTDEDGDFSDWIELYNAGPEAVQMKDWSLSDNAETLRKWIFPSYTMPAQSHLLIFASGKDRKTIVAHWETVIRQGDVWRYQIGSVSIPAHWAQADFNDNSWQTGATGIGYGDGDDATLVPSVISVFARRLFTLTDPAAVLGLVLHIDYDDGFVAYLNGREIARANIGQVGVPPAWNQSSNSDHEAIMYPGGAPERFDIENYQSLLTPGVNLLAVEVHNKSVSSSDLTLIPFLSLGLAEEPADAQGTPQVLRLAPLYCHSNFAVSASGETLYLSNGAGALVDSVTVPSSAANVSFGRKGDGGGEWDFFAAPTPAAANSATGLGASVAPVMFSTTGGFYHEPFTLKLSCETFGADIRYTTDGSEPDSSSPVYTSGPFISQTMVVRARAFRSGFNASPITTHTFIFAAASKLPVISLTTDPVNLWDAETGIYVLGDSYEPSNPYYGANFWQEWEKPIHVEFFEADGRPAFSQNCGTRIFGGWSRSRPQKGMAIFARSSYGKNRIDYPLFNDLPFDVYYSFILRNAGNDWDRTLFADGLIHDLLNGLDIERQAFRPCVIYLNGQYWGILNMREKINEEYFSQHHGVDPDLIDELESNGTVVEGTNDHYLAMMNYLRTHDISLNDHYKYIKTQMDVEEYLTYQAVQIYIDNRDWPGNNIKYWRPQSEGGRWRWCLFDTEWGFGINGYGAGGNRYPYDYNTLQYATSATQTPNHHGNPPWSTELLRTLLKNEEFKYAFINRFADLMNTVFSPDRVSFRITAIQSMIEVEMKNHYDKWRRPVWWTPERLWWNSFNEWYNFIKIMRDFGQYRPSYMKSHLSSKFGPRPWYTLRISCEPADGGGVRLNDFLDVSTGEWTGSYMGGIPIDLAAEPRPGYRFVEWQGISESREPQVSIAITQNGALKAVFALEEHTPGRIVINEINYRAADTFDTEDWIELYNAGAEPIDLTGWRLKDDDDEHGFQFKAGTLLPGDAYLVVCRDSIKFRALFPNIRVAGNLSFGLSSSGDQVRLYDASDQIADSLQFSNSTPWPVEANGGGPTLELIHPHLDNALPQNWIASQGHGTPGARNSQWTGIDLDPSDSIPDRLRLNQNYPNPFNATTTVYFTVPWMAKTRLSVYNLQGALIKTLANEKMAAGTHAIRWDGTDARGYDAGSGIYFCELLCDGARTVRRMLLLR